MLKLVKVFFVKGEKNDKKYTIWTVLLGTENEQGLDFVVCRLFVTNLRNLPLIACGR
jgi:hypothetical protein